MGRGRVYKRGSVWWIQYSIGGRQYRESAGTSRRDAADALLAKRIGDIWSGRHFPDAQDRGDLTIGGLRDLWLHERQAKRSIADDRRRLGAAVLRFGEHRLLSMLSGDDVAAWRDELAAKVSRATVNRHLAVLRSALRLAADRGYTHRDPMRGIRLEPESNARNRICSPSEYAALRDAADPEMRILVVIGYWCGMRLGEIVGLTWAQLDLRAGEIRLAGGDTKEGDRKTVPLPREAIADLATIPRQLSGKVFAGTMRTYSRRFGSLVIVVGADGLRFHDLRHTAVTNMRRAGVDLVTIMRITGHKTLAMLQRYNVVTDDDLREAMVKTEHHAAGRERS